MSPSAPLVEAALDVEQRYARHGWHGDDGIAPELYLLTQRGHRTRWRIDVILAHHNTFWSIDNRPAEVLRHVTLGLADDDARRYFRGLAMAMEVWTVPHDPDDPMSDEVDYLLSRRLLNTHPLRQTARVVIAIAADDTRVYLRRDQSDDPAAPPNIVTDRIGGDVPNALGDVIVRMLSVPEVPS